MPQTPQAQAPWFDALRLSSESMRLSSKSTTASRHRERQADLLSGAWLSSRGSIPQAFRLVFKLILFEYTDRITNTRHDTSTDNKGWYKAEH